jgi:hypothetical protein
MLNYNVSAIITLLLSQILCNLKKYNNCNEVIHFHKNLIFFTGTYKIMANT